MKFTRKAQRSPFRGIAPLMLALALPVSALAAPPPAASAAGYTENTYSSNFTAATVDMNETLNRGYKWYIYNLFGRKATPAGTHINGDGSVTIEGDKSGAIGMLASVAQYQGSNAWVGNAFGGGAYFEWVAAWSPEQVVAGHNAGNKVWPSFWSLPMEGNFIPGGNWVGQPAGYAHNVEVDFFEAVYWWTTTGAYGTGLHDWYGIRNKTCNPGLCVVSMINPTGGRDPPAGTNMNTYHTYGALWVPATATKEGTYSAYFDNKLIGHTVSYTKYANQAPSPVGKSWVFGAMDQQHLFFILGSAQGVPFKLSKVDVWQKSDADNLKN
jgi:hypothetical protein